MTTFKDRLKKLRTAKGLSQRALADQIHISSSSIGMYESGQRQPDFETLETIADYFNVDIDFLLGRKDTTMRYVEVRPDGQPSEYYQDATVRKISEAMRTNPDARIIFDAVSDMEPEDIRAIANLVKKRSD